MKKIITYGTFDLLHYGHINLLRKARELGDYLIVGLSTDEFNLAKGKTSYFTYEERYLLLESIKYVDLIIPEKDWDQKISDITDHEVSIFVIGDDWKGKFDYLTSETDADVIYLERTKNISTSKIKDDLNRLSSSS